jgi:ubiquinone biosynthesis protein COQ4
MIATTDRSKETVILESFVELVKAPYADFSAIGKLSQILNDPATLQTIASFLNTIPQCQQALVDRPILGNIDLDRLHQLPTDTLGYMYANHMLRNGLIPLPINEIAKDSLTFMCVHIAETHDIWHVVTGSNTDRSGEVQLEAFCTAQLTSDRLFLALIAKNLLKTAIYEIEFCEQIMDGLTKGWMMGRQAKPLFGIQWNKLWETPLAEVRVSLNISLI